jgi:hypothetical protein
LDDGGRRAATQEVALDVVDAALLDLALILSRQQHLVQLLNRNSSR